MDWTIAVVKALKSAGYVLAGGVVAALLAPEFSASLAQIADAVSSAVPVVGPLLKGVISSLLVAAVAAVAAALDNARKHWND